MDAQQAVKALAAIRLGVGLGGYALPRATGRTFGIDPADNEQAPYITRLFGVRDLALAWGATQTTPAARRTWLQAGVACDLADVASAALGGRAGYLSRPTAIAAGTVAAAAAALGLVALGAPDPPA